MDHSQEEDNIKCLQHLLVRLQDLKKTTSEENYSCSFVGQIWANPKTVCRFLQFTVMWLKNGQRRVEFISSGIFKLKIQNLLINKKHDIFVHMRKCNITEIENIRFTYQWFSGKGLSPITKVTTCSVDINLLYSRWKVCLTSVNPRELVTHTNRPTPQTYHPDPTLTTHAHN